MSEGLNGSLSGHGAQGERLPPGPRSPRAIQTLEWMRRPMELMDRCRSRYGKIFSLKLGPSGQVVMIADPRVAKQVLTADPDLFPAGDTNGLFKDVVGENSILVLDGPRHIAHRKRMLPAVGRHAQRYGEMIAEIARNRVSGWRAGEEIALLDEMEAISFEVVMRIALGGDGTSDREQRLRELMPEMMDRCDSSLTLIPWFRRELGGHSPFGRLVRVLGQLDELFHEAISERRRDPLIQVRDDVLSLLLQATEEDGSPLEEKVIRDELLTILMAGYETTTAGLTWSFERLLRAPDKLELLLLDLEAGSDRYLEAVVKETLRRRPVIPIVARRSLVPIELLGYTIPAGSVLMVPIYLIHLDPEIYDEPLKFRPERFLDTEPEAGAYIPFGGGVRRCLGASLAQHEMMIVLRTVLEQATLSAVDPEDEPVERRRFTFSPGDGGSAVVESVLSSVPTAPGSKRFQRPVAPAEPVQRR